MTLPGTDAARTMLTRSALTFLARKALRRLGQELIHRSRLPYSATGVCRLLEKNGISTVFDAGANAGQWSGELRRAGYGGTIVSFEPTKTAHAQLSETARGDAKWIIAPRMALAEKRGVASMNVSAHSQLSSLLPFESSAAAALPGATAQHTEQVETVPLDEIFDEYASGVDRVFLKLDVQGSERAVLAGARRSMKRIAGMQVEMSLRPLYQGEATVLELYADLAAEGFEAVLMFPGYYSMQTLSHLQVDGVFIRPSA